MLQCLSVRILSSNFVYYSQTQTAISLSFALTLIWVGEGGNFTPTPVGFPLITPVTLAFCST